jgi:hypothetical protein
LNLEGLRDGRQKKKERQDNSKEEKRAILREQN